MEKITIETIVNSLAVSWSNIATYRDNKDWEMLAHTKSALRSKIEGIETLMIYADNNDEGLMDDLKTIWKLTLDN